jgi:spermidine/putrescine transport system permease protein
MAAPLLVFLLLGFSGLLVLGYSVMPPKTFSLAQAPTAANFIAIVTDSYYLVGA